MFDSEKRTDLTPCRRVLLVIKSLSQRGFSHIRLGFCHLVACFFLLLFLDSGQRRSEYIMESIGSHGSIS